MNKENNGWIKCKDRLPNLHAGYSRTCLVYGIEDQDDHEETVFTALMGKKTANGTDYTENALKSNPLATFFRRRQCRTNKTHLQPI
ncbi:DUF551 domain-containing protein [Actinobacillus sp. GY-402]|nr:DUF551 domain-containing protein [Actinobacillus sp. GY-402]